MRPLTMAFEVARDLFCEQLRQFVDACAGFDDMGLLEVSLCRGWSRLDLVVHVRMGLQEMAGAAGASTDRVPVCDAASYWSSHPDDRDVDPVGHILWLRRTASAYQRPSGAITHLRVVGDVIERVITQAADGPVVFQGKALTMGNFLATWIVELAVHQLDLGLAAVPVGAELARRTLEAVADADLPTAFTDVEAVLVGLGRMPCPAEHFLSARFPISL